MLHDPRFLLPPALLLTVAMLPSVAAGAGDAGARSPAARSGQHSAEDYERHVAALKPKLKRLEGRFSVVVEPPFVVIGDSGRRDVQRHAERLVRPTVRALRAQYGMRDPEHILDVWLFAGRRSYEENVYRLVGRRPHTPFGYYSSTHRALVMNARTGGGTLVHELVHPFVEASFPDCPAWLNEGLGSLYEAVGWPGGRMRGYLNWRLPGLQEAIREGGLPSFQQLLSLGEVDFYDRDPGTNYGQSRYLVYYLQEQGLLEELYRRFLAARREDPTGYATLKEVLGVEDMQRFQAEWERWVLGLRWGGVGGRAGGSGAHTPKRRAAPRGSSRQRRSLTRSTPPARPTETRCVEKP